MLTGYLSPRHAAFSCCEWKRRPPDMEGRYEYIKKADAESRQGADLQPRAEQGASNSSQ